MLNTRLIAAAPRSHSTPPLIPSAKEKASELINRQINEKEHDAVDVE